MKEQSLADYYLKRLEKDAVNILGLHAEIEGLRYAGWLRTFLAVSLKLGVQFPLLSEIAQREYADATVDEMVQGEIPGRAGLVARQKGSS